MKQKNKLPVLRSIVGEQTLSVLIICLVVVFSGCETKYSQNQEHAGQSIHHVDTLSQTQKVVLALEAKSRDMLTRLEQSDQSHLGKNNPVTIDVLKQSLLAVSINEGFKDRFDYPYANTSNKEPDTVMHGQYYYWINDIPDNYSAAFGFLQGVMVLNPALDTSRLIDMFGVYHEAVHSNQQKYVTSHIKTEQDYALYEELFGDKDTLKKVFPKIEYTAYITELEFINQITDDLLRKFVRDPKTYGREFSEMVGAETNSGNIGTLYTLGKIYFEGKRDGSLNPHLLKKITEIYAKKGIPYINTGDGYMKPIKLVGNKMLLDSRYPTYIYVAEKELIGKWPTPLEGFPLVGFSYNKK